MKTVDLDPTQNYIFGFHPHGETLRGSGSDPVLSTTGSGSDPFLSPGVLVAGAFGNFCTEATGFSRLFPGLRSHLLMLPFWFRVPFFRDYIMCGGE